MVLWCKSGSEVALLCICMDSSQALEFLDRYRFVGDDELDTRLERVCRVGIGEWEWEI